MATPTTRLAESLAELKALQDRGCVAIRASQLGRAHRERLQRGGFIREVMKGWYISSRPDEPAGDTTDWYSSFWAFIGDYLNDRFGPDWCLSAEQSIGLHTGDWTVPKQLLVRSPKGGNKPFALLHGVSMFDLRLNLPPEADIDIRQGLRVMRLPAALIGCGPGQFTARPVELRAALAMIADASEILDRLLAGGHSKVAGRLAGAFRNIGREQIADDIVAAMRAAGYAVNESDPFEEPSPLTFAARETSPYVNRMRMQWLQMREYILEHFPAPPGQRRNAASYLREVEAVYVSDAYNSLSIEGYRVSAELIERVRVGNWNPDADENDRDRRNALAARGYWQAFQSVKKSVEKVLGGQNPGVVADRDHAAWYRELFEPGVIAGLIKPANLAGYRNGPVYIRRSKHVPPRPEAVRELMPAFFDLLQQEQEAAVRVVLGHFMFVYIHPYFDGNGRTARFLMNVMLSAGGYPWTVIPLAQRDSYMAALEAASVEQNIEPLTQFLADLIKPREG